MNISYFLRRVSSYLPNARKASLLSYVQPRSKVLEIGAGFGFNLKYLPRDIEYVALEPDSTKHPYLKLQITRKGIDRYRIVSDFAEDMTFLNEFDYVVSTLVLCSVGDVSRTLEKIHGALKPGGMYLFIEHVSGKPRSFLKLLQNMFARLWKKYVGCSVDRDVEQSIRASHFSNPSFQYYYNPLQPFIARRVVGFARRKIQTLDDLLVGVTPESMRPLVDFGPDVGKEIITN